MADAPTTRTVLRIFISSTAIDLTSCRDKVRGAVQLLNHQPIAMETFSAQSGAPASECMRQAAEADAVICIVAHRYGYVSPRDLGGDGERSITSGTLLADTCGFAKYSIDLRLAPAELQKPSNAPAKPSTSRKRPIANTPGARPTASTSVAAPSIHS